LTGFDRNYGLVKTLRKLSWRKPVIVIARSKSSKDDNNKEGHLPLTALQKIQLIVGIAISVSTAIIGWQTFRLSAQTSETNAYLKEIEQQFAQTKFGFEQFRDVYDRIEKYLSSKNQNKARGRVLIVLINSLPNSNLRTELFNVVTKTAELDSIAAEAANKQVGVVAVGPVEPKDSSFFGNLSLKIDEEKFQVMTNGELGFIDSSGKKWVVPKGVIANGASIPRIYWSQLGSPLNSEYTIPLILHDYYSTTRTESYEAVNKMFYEALLKSGVSEVKGKIFYAAVAHFGPRWK